MNLLKSGLGSCREREGKRGRFLFYPFSQRGQDAHLAYGGAMEPDPAFFNSLRENSKPALYSIPLEKRKGEKKGKGTNQDKKKNEGI